MSRVPIILLVLLGMPATSLASGAPRGGPPLPPAPSDDVVALRAWHGRASDVAGGVVYSAGELIVTDSPFDDAGADTVDNRDPGEDAANTQAPGANAGQGNAGTATGGPDGDDDAFLKNAADIVETRVAAGPHAWFLLVRFNGPVGAVVARIGGRTLRFDRRVVRGRSVALRVPYREFDPGLRTLPLFVGAGRAPDDLLDLAYVPREGYDSYWRDRVQADDIAAGSFGDDAVPVDFGALRDGCPCPAPAVPTRGLLTRVFRSGQRLGSGVGLQPSFAQDTGTFPPYLYRSPTQPYAVYVPRHPTGAMVLLLHFLGGNYMSYPLTSIDGIRGWAEHLGVTVVMPEARGEGGWYQGEAEKDVFEAWRDAARHYALDRERVYLAGMSMGGFGTWRLGQLYPDLFARGIVWAGPVIPSAVWPYPADPTGPSCPSSQPDCAYTLVDLFGNARSLPYLVIHGGADDLVPASGAEHWMSAFAANGLGTYRYAFYPDRTHETSFPGTTGAWVERWLKGLPRRARTPSSVTYTVLRSLQQPAFGLRHDGAYWVSGLRLAPGLTRGRIAASRAVADDSVKAVGPEISSDALGPYRLTGADVTAAPSASGHLSLTTKGLRRAVVRVGGGRLRVSGTTDRPLTLVLQRPGGRRTLQLPAGGFTRSVPRLGPNHADILRVAPRGGAVR